ncbi:LacI family DNA-binding transcriptional regulator [Brevibacterium sp. UMB10442]|uniref:LacI family DNA-binding transcriptional regulator n=1 Tax=Brevibacterium sp. UMB1308A TaxID=3050608 RepID=UPI00254CB232|nr:LacI family DNA-binding transcriptional regulator [Brevibacterium sp. UMB1308A]MDK7749581.1 LacI family DNA-binding transcriptional regulator [Brevibacterium sp. UMB10442]MDK8346170.1 LacI family DNA-binding transcriptional regulator [Brevibacterium sp. UMB1308B]MDK8712396.1 LacI family DNA-binding transcriptional regulator [Brevibacterium sp. UMB1308A]
MTVRIHDVAQAAGVSVTTVSRVLSDRGSVAEATRQKVLSAAQQVGYTRSTFLPRNDVRFIAVAMPQDPEHWQLEVSRLVNAELQSQGILTMTPLIDTNLASLKTSIQAGAGLVVTPTFTHVDVDVPVVRFDESSFAGAHTSLNETIAAKLDLATSLSLAFEHLTDLGHRKIGLVCKDSGELADLLASRFLAEHPMRNLGSAEDWIVRVSKSYSGGIHAAMRLKDAGGTAVIVQGQLQLFGVLDAIRKRGLTVPRDMSVVGIGDSLTTQYTGPPATVLALDSAAMAQTLAAATRSVLHIPGEQMKTVPPNFRPKLIARGSTSAGRA